MNTLCHDLRALDEHEAVHVSRQERVRLVDVIVAAPRLRALTCTAACVTAVDMHIRPMWMVCKSTDVARGITLQRSVLCARVAIHVSPTCFYFVYASQTRHDVTSLYNKVTRHLHCHMSADTFVQRWHTALREARSVRLMATLVCLRAIVRPLSAEVAEMIDREFVRDDYV
jgi:hypothetical protein